MLNQTSRRLKRPANVVFLEKQFVLSEKSSISCVDEVIQHLSFGTSRDSNKAREFLVAEAAKSLRDICRSRPSRLAQLLAQSEVPFHVRPFQEHIHAQLHRFRALPRDDLPEVLPSSHVVE